MSLPEFDDRGRYIESPCYGCELDFCTYCLLDEENDTNMKKIYSFRASDETEKYLRYLMKKNNHSMTISICDAIKWYAEKMMLEDSKQLFIDKLQPNLAFDIPNSQLLRPENPH